MPKDQNLTGTMLNAISTIEEKNTMTPTPMYFLAYQLPSRFSVSNFLFFPSMHRNMELPCFGKKQNFPHATLRTDKFLQSLLNSLSAIEGSPHLGRCLVDNIPADQLIGILAHVSLLSLPLLILLDRDT